MDVQDDSFDFRTTLVDKSCAAFGYAVLIFGADCITTNPSRHLILGIYVVMYVIQNIKSDMRLSIIRGLSLVLFGGCFYSWDFSLLSIYGVFMITKMSLMTFGSASLWVTIPGVIFDTYSIVVGNTELATYSIIWVLLSLVSRFAKFCLSPFRELSPFLQALVATAVVQFMVLLLATGAASETFQDVRRRFSRGQQNVIVSTAAMVPTSPYTYARRLTSGMEIRLLKLYPHTNGDEVRCEIVYHPLEKLLDYEAVSYTWGDTTEKAIVVVDGQALETSVKVSEILRSLRNTWKPRMLWIDFICINQDDTEEKSHQVQLMKCKDPRDKVFALLGLIRGADHPLIAPDYHKDEVQVFKDVARYVFTVEQTSRKLLALAVAGVGNYRRLRDLPSWVPDWASNMRRKDEGEEEESTEHASTSKHNMLFQTISNYGNSNDIMRSNQSHFETSTIELGYRAALGTDPQVELVEDDILGIQGFLVDEIDRLTSIFELPFNEDMKISHTDMSLFFLAWFEEAEVLAARARLPYPTGENVEDIVWRTMTGDRLLQDDDRKVSRPAPREFDCVYREFKAATSRLQEAFGLLGAQAVIEVRDISHELNVHTAGGKSAFEFWMQVLCGQSGHPEVWKLITAGTKFAGGDGPLPDFPEVSGDAQFWYTQLTEFFENDDTKVIGERFARLFQIFYPRNLNSGFNESHPDALDGPDELSHQNVLSYAQMISRFSEALRMSFERRVCLTKNGYIGLAPPLTRIGDRVCIFFGVDAPYLVRPEEGHVIEETTDVLRCQLVGECYMHGMMDGEMMHLSGNELWFQH